MIRRIALIYAFIFLFSPGLLSATPFFRGMAVAYGSIHDEEVADLANIWRVNYARFQVGNDAEMDGTTGAAYIAMMEEEFEKVDRILPLFAQHNIQVEFNLYSPPGGFETRIGRPHSLMFSQPALQEEFIAMWRRIMERYKDNPTINAFDILNEPAIDNSRLAEGARNWYQLLQDTIASIREIAPTRQLIAKAAYANIAGLYRLADIIDENTDVSYHGYFSGLRYQHSGVNGIPTGLPLPKLKKTKNIFLKRLGKFYKRAKRNSLQNNTRAIQYPPCVRVSEFAVSHCAAQSGKFIDDILSLLETDGFSSPACNQRRERRRERCRRRHPYYRFHDVLPDICHKSYIYHTFDEDPVWDPRYVCGANNNPVLRGLNTDRGTVLREYFGLNS